MLLIPFNMTYIQYAVAIILLNPPPTPPTQKNNNQAPLIKWNLEKLASSHHMYQMLHLLLIFNGDLCGARIQEFGKIC